jgi:uncharacterized RmlC-like cupin family protein
MAEKSAPLDRAAVCAVVHAGVPFIGKQGFSYAPAISAETVGTSAIHMQLLTIPPGGRAKAHKHKAHETAIARSGEFMYIPANVPHLPYNMSQTEPCVAVVARTDPNEQESVVLLPELDALHILNGGAS